MGDIAACGMTELGLFPLPLVLLPTERVPLHIFEERYRELIGECLDSGNEFGLVYADDDGLRDVGTRASVTEVLARMVDGRMDILVEGGDRFRLLELTAGRSFYTGEVVPVEDEKDPAEAKSIERALDLFDRLRELTGSDVDLPEADAVRLSFVLAGRVELPPVDKLELLRDVSERSRMARVCDLLEHAIATARRVRGAAERAATNGRVHLG
ncbi:MAG: LON peptidase substrate-binding domain-containing protein [Thermoleophilia bacterium]|nr:LON peptidase substrate-binding domain-containing protein [Thermoleophilia bacterium]MDH4339091.1 LON peptidase substrate-binding domain-containing protein [Thermoleophilia bacterium]